MKISDKALLDLVKLGKTLPKKEKFKQKIFCHSKSFLQELSLCDDCKEKCDNYYILKKILEGK